MTIVEDICYTVLLMQENTTELWNRTFLFYCPKDTLGKQRATILGMCLLLNPILVYLTPFTLSKIYNVVWDININDKYKNDILTFYIFIL